MKLSAIILAAGQGTRMRSRRAKVLHTIGSVPMLTHVINAASSLDLNQLVLVYGHDGKEVQSAIDDANLCWVHQQEQLGTGHAVQQAMSEVDDDAMVLVLYGDTPLIQAQTLSALIDLAGDGLALLTTNLDKPSGYGRIVRNAGGVVESIVEHKDATIEQLEIEEVNTGILAVSAGRLKGWLAKIDNKNAQKEYYLTDIVALAAKDKVEVKALICTDSDEVMGINDRRQQAAAERVFQRREVEKQMMAGVTMLHPETVAINGTLACGADVVIGQSVIFNGNVNIGDNVTIGPFCVINESTIGVDVQIQSHSVIDNASIGEDCRIGPFSRIRPETKLADRVHVGNFVEVKKSSVESGSKINHLSYIGDSVVGSGVNIGAGTITCNYDGANKFQTTIEDNAFIGSDTQLVAPVTIGAGATIAAGSTITRNVDAGVLELSRVAQKTVKNWKRPRKK